jgi:hypothetical protein
MGRSFSSGTGTSAIITIESRNLSGKGDDQLRSKSATTLSMLRLTS